MREVAGLTRPRDDRAIAAAPRLETTLDNLHGKRWVKRTQ